MKRVTFLFSLICALLISTVSYAQYDLIDFESDDTGAAWTWVVSENDTNPPVAIISNPVSGGNNTSATVAKFTAMQTGQEYALLFTDDISKFKFDATWQSAKKFDATWLDFRPVKKHFPGQKKAVHPNITSPS